MTVKNKYVIIRDDLPNDPATIITEGLLIGRLLDCEVALNHPAVSRVQAGIRQIDDDHYVFALRPGNPVLLNGKPISENEALASGDLLRVGPYQVDIDETDDALILRISLQIGMAASEIDVSSPGLSTDQLVMPSDRKRSAKPRASPVAGTRALDIFWDKRIREAGKMVRPSALFPRSQRRSGKAQFNWSPTTDLKSRWPISVFVWATLIVGVIAVAAAHSYTNAYTPGPLSKAHATTQLSLVPAIATAPNAGSCTTCHSWTRNIEEKCADCHKTQAFEATVIHPHEAAGIGCVDCHAEHRGADSNLVDGALVSCTGCHNDANPKAYAGKRVSTPHNGTFGYPVVNGIWSVKAVNEEEWELRKMPVTRLPFETEEKWRSKQFHAFHTDRVRLVPGIPGNEQGQLSCSSCHKFFGEKTDRETPRTTCGACHNGRTATGSDRVLIPTDKPNCTSCHMQHIRDQRRWGTPRLAV
jgi:pSer/pThr/pTyr-binding forkhead associated (FHA) protein